jgi:hypothetical protein
MIEGGTFQVGLTVMKRMASLMSGMACVPGLPTTIRVDQIALPRS